MGGDRGEDDAVQGQNRGENDHRPVAVLAREHRGRGKRRRFLAGDGLSLVAATENQQMKRQADNEMEKRIDPEGVLPADRLREIMRYRPENGRGEAAEQGQIGDRAAGFLAGDLGEGGEGGIIEYEAHRRAKDEPARKIDPGLAREREDQAAERRQARAHGHYAPATISVDGASGGAGNEAADQQSDREGAEDEELRPAAIRCYVDRERAQSII